MTLYLFQGATDGSYPNGGLVLDAFGTLYGTTVETTDRVYGGLVYELSPGGGSTWTESVLHSFASTGGAFPSGALVSDAAGNLYGTTSQGGSSAGVCMLFLDQGTGCGAAFKLTYSPDGSWSYSEIYDFTGIGTDGAGPKASLIFDSLGNLYGVTGAGGGNGLGTVFQLAPRPSRGWIHTTLYSLDVSWQNGVDPDTALLIDAAGNLFGVTPWGGKASGICGGCGVVFESLNYHPLRPFLGLSPRCMHLLGRPMVARTTATFRLLPWWPTLLGIFTAPRPWEACGDAESRFS